MKHSLISFLVAFFITESVYGQTDTITKIVPDDYPVTNNMFKGNYENRESDGITSLNKAWFTNDTLNQTLVFELYTDYHRLEIYHFYNNNIPEELINRMILNVATGPHKNIFETASTKQKQTSFRGFLNSSKKISQSYFTSYKGLKLGDKKEKVFHVYGKPNSYSISKNTETYEWKFEGDHIGNERKVSNNKTLAKDSFGFGVTMFFTGNELIAIILSNDIP